MTEYFLEYNPGHHPETEGVMGLLSTYRTIVAAQRSHPPVSAEAAGDEGERLTLQAVDRLLDRRAARLGGRYYPAVRVPRPGDQGRYEIDLLVASPYGLASLEVKHWGGEVEETRPGTWTQISSRGETREYEDPLALVQAKSAAVGEYLRAQNVPVPAEALTAAVVLTNPRLALGPRLANRPGLVRLAMLEELLTPWVNPNAVGFWAGLARLVGMSRTTSPLIPDIAAVTRALDRLPTWDVVELYGGRLLKGDVVGSGLALTTGQFVSRHNAVIANVTMPRNLIFGWFVTPRVSWRDANGATFSERARVGTTLGLRRAGQRQEEQVPIEHIHTVSFGGSGQGAFKGPRPALESYPPGMVYQGHVAGVQDFGVFVDLDGYRDGLVHVSKLRGRSPSSYQRGQAVTVRVVRTEVRDGKERIELDLHGG